MNDDHIDIRTYTVLTHATMRLIFNIEAPTTQYNRQYVYNKLA